MRVAIAGCGVIADRYAEAIAAAPTLELVGAHDVLEGRADDFCGRHGGRPYGSLEELLADEAVDTLVNLTPPQAHAAVTRAGLEAGRHVHTEKPVALAYEEARGLAELAAARGLRLSAAPATWLGPSLQTAWRLVRDDELGQVRVVYAEANWGRIESWHPTPQALYEAGPVMDVGVYPLTALTAMFGPVRRVHAYGRILQPERVTKRGAPFTLTTPDFSVGLFELEDGPVVRLTSSFWVGNGKQHGFELHGDRRSLFVANFLDFDARVELTAGHQTFEPVELLGDPRPGVDWGVALVELAAAIEEGRPHRAGAEHAAHVVEVLNAVTASVRDGRAVDVESSFPRPAPMDWAQAESGRSAG